MSCTMPDIPWFKDWFNERFGDLCEAHDEAYAQRLCKICSDYWLAHGIADRGFLWLSFLTFLAVQLPWVWAEYLWKKWSK